MNDIKRMAKEAGILIVPRWGTCYTGNIQLAKFAALVAEDLAKLAAQDEYPETDFDYGYISGQQAMASAIRAKYPKEPG